MLSFVANTKRRFLASDAGTGISLPVTLICGSGEGETIILSAGVHSREYIGIQALTELAREISPENVRGRVIILHCCNYEGLIRRSADVMPQDGVNLNRAFPGNPEGGVTERYAAYLEREFLAASDYIVDLHSGGFCEELTPHVYFQGTAAKEVSAVSEKIARLVDVRYIYRSSAKNGFYSHAGTLGVAGIILERGGCGLVKREEIDADKADVLNILRGLGFLCDGTAAEIKSPTLLTGGSFEDAPVSGCWHPTHRAGDIVRAGECLGEIRDIYGEPLCSVSAKTDGVILYETASLGIEKGAPMVAYGELHG